MPHQRFDSRGIRPTGRFRLAPNIFGATLEELIEYSDGRKRWQATICSYALPKGEPSEACDAHYEKTGDRRIRNNVFGMAVVEEARVAYDDSTIWVPVTGAVELP